MGLLEQKEVAGFKQDIKLGQAKQMVEKASFEKKLLEGLGAEMEDVLEHPEKRKEMDRSAKKYIRKKRFAAFKENIRKIFVGDKKKETI